MATPKRKRQTTRTKARKKPKYAEPTSDPELSASDQLWEAEDILDERRVGRKTQYLIQWKGNDPVTLQPYTPTWEPEDNPTPGLLESWLQQKAARESERAIRDEEHSGPSEQPKSKSLQPRPGRKSRVVESSPEASSVTETIHSRPSTPARESAAPQPPSSVFTSPSCAETPAHRVSPKIHIGHRGDSFDPNEYEPFSQLSASQQASLESASQRTDLDSSQLFAARPENRSGIVPDSQSSSGERSFVPATQQTTGTTQPSSTVDESQEDVTEDSGLLEIVQQATSRAPSPARSIPETVYDTSAESQSQRQVEPQTQDQAFALETAESSQAVVTEEIVQESNDTTGRASPIAAEEEEEEVDRLETQSTSSAPTSPITTVPVHPVEVEASQHTRSSISDPQEVLLETDAQLQIGPTFSTPTEDQEPGADSVPGASEVVEVGDSQDVEQAHDTQAAVFSLQDSIAAAPYQSDIASILDAAEDELQSAVTHTEPESVPVENAQPVQDASTSEQSVPGVVVVNPTVQQAASQDNTEASLPEHSVPGEAAKSPFHDQHAPPNPLAPTPHPENQSGGTSFADTATANSSATEAHTQARRPDTIRFETSATAPIQASSDSAPRDSHNSSVTSTQPEDQTLFDEFLKPEYARSPEAAQPSAVEPEAVEHLVDQQHTEEAIRRRDFAFDFESQTLRSTNHSTSSREQNAQIVHTHNDLSTQEDIFESIRPSVEHLDAAVHSSPGSRHDSSQDSPKRQLSSLHSSSPIAQPPDQSLNTLVSNAPPRPETPLPTSSLSIMATPDVGKELEKSIKDAIAKRKAENPFTPTRRMRRSNFTPSSATPAAAGPSDAATLTRNLPQTAILSSVAAADGTRSPSTVPDRSPAPPVPTSLRAMALTQASKVAAEENSGPFNRAESARPQDLDNEQDPTPPSILTTEPTIEEVEVEILSSDNEELDDATDDDDESLLNDDLQMAVEEHVVPLAIDGRQRSEYSDAIMRKATMLQAFLKDRDNFDNLDEIEKLLSYLRNVETHIDLVYQEAAQGSGNDGEQDTTTQISFSIEFSLDNSIKFKFLYSLFEDMREQNKHILLVTQGDEDNLYRIIERFCKGMYLRYNMPTKGRQTSGQTQGDLLVTIFPSTSSPIVQAADVIICLDGAQSAADIRQKNWAANPNLEVVPVLHLVISRTVGHIDRYLSSSLGDRDRMHTILASLAHMKNELGKPLDEDLERAPKAANYVAKWLEETGNDRGLWPLRSIGSVKDVIEFQTQALQTSPASPALERPKRPHDDEELDPAKRMRMTPQPQGLPSSSIGHDNEITRISDSMPETATNDVASLQAQLVLMEQALKDERAAREADQTRFREEAVMWDKQQTVHEDSNKEHRVLQHKHHQLEEKVKAITTNTETLRTRLETRTAEHRALEEQLQKQRETHSLSDDDKVAEITNLRTELAQAIAEKERVEKHAATVESTLDFLKEQYRIAQNAAESAAANVQELEKQNAKLTHQASGEAAKLKALHIKTVTSSLQTKVKSQDAEISILKKTIQLAQDENARLKASGGRMGVGTRGTTPKTGSRSRAASPAMGRASGLSNLRN